MGCRRPQSPCPTAASGPRVGAPMPALTPIIECPGDGPGTPVTGAWVARRGCQQEVPGQSACPGHPGDSRHECENCEILNGPESPAGVPGVHPSDWKQWENLASWRMQGCKAGFRAGALGPRPSPCPQTACLSERQHPRIGKVERLVGGRHHQTAAGEMPGQRRFQPGGRGGIQHRGRLVEQP